MYTDFFLLVAIVLFGISGFMQGLILQVISLVSLILIVLFSTPLARILKERSDIASFESAPTFVLWCFSALTIAMIAVIVRMIYLKTRKAPGLTPLDRWLGFGLGLVKGLVFAFVVGVVMVNIPRELRKTFADLDKDFQKSKMISGSQQLKEWDFIPSIAELKSIQKEIRQQEEARFEELQDMEY